MPVTIHFKTVKVVSFTLCVFNHSHTQRDRGRDFSDEPQARNAGSHWKLAEARKDPSSNLKSVALLSPGFQASKTDFELLPSRTVREQICLNNLTTALLHVGLPGCTRQVGATLPLFGVAV